MTLLPDEETALTYGAEEGPFYYHHIRRTRSYSRMKHYHRTYEIFYLLQGERSFFIGDRAFHVQEGDLIFIDRQVVHKASDLGPPRHERIVLNFSEDFLGQGHPYADPLLFLAFERREAHRLDAGERLYVQSLMTRIANETTQRLPGYLTAVRLLLTELLLFAARRMQQARLSGQEATRPAHSKITDIVRYIHEHYAEKLGLTALSSAFYISAPYLSRTFKAVTGFGLTEYINLTRIKEAQRLLRETEAKVIDIAQRVGFENAGHFDRMFKKITGTTPIVYRRHHGY